MVQMHNRSDFVYFIDHDPAVRQTLSSLMSSAKIAHVGFDSARAFLDDYCDRGPACIITAIRLPGLSGLQLLKNARSRGITHPIIVLTAYADVPTAVEAFRCGAADFFEKPASESLLLAQIQHWLDADHLEREKRTERTRLLDGFDRLSPRERHVFSMLLQGLSNKQIAWEFDLTKQTVSAHRASILDKMGSENLTDLVVQMAAADLLAEFRNETSLDPGREAVESLQTCQV